MMKQIICNGCHAKMQPVHPGDVAAGFKRRVVGIVARTPEDHVVRIYTGPTTDNLKLAETKQVPSLVCDRCGTNIADGTSAFAVTMWRGEEPPLWETGYNQPILHETKS